MERSTTRPLSTQQSQLALAAEQDTTQLPSKELSSTSRYLHDQCTHYSVLLYRVCRGSEQSPKNYGDGEFAGIALIDTEVYIDGGKNCFIDTNNFYRGIRNTILDLTLMPNCILGGAEVLFIVSEPGNN